MTPPLQFPIRDSDNSFRSNYQILNKEETAPSFGLGSADKYVHDSSTSADETPEFLGRFDENILSQQNLQFSTVLNPAEPARHPFPQPSLWQVPEFTGNGYWSQQTDVSVYVFPFPKIMLIFGVPSKFQFF